MYSEQEREALMAAFSQCDKLEYEILPEDKAFIENVMKKETKNTKL